MSQAYNQNDHLALTLEYRISLNIQQHIRTKWTFYSIDCTMSLTMLLYIYNIFKQ